MELKRNLLLCTMLLLGAALALVLVPTQTSAQEFRSTLTGQVTDPSGAVIPNATVTAVMNTTGQTYTGKTTSAGVYTIPYVLPGTYTMTVKAAGFQTAIQETVLILAAQSRDVNFKLQVGSVAQSVTVTSTPPIIDTASGSGGSVLQARAVENLPLNGRQVYMLVRTTPGSQFMQQQFGASGYSGTRGWDVSNNYSIGGSSAQAGNFNNFTMNGTNITIMTGFGPEGTWMTAPNVDALQSVNIMDQMFDARYGRTGGGVVNMVTKAGTNAYHGDAYEYWENGALNANVFENNLNGLPVQNTIQNQFGGTFGGPIIKNKVFFFASYEGYRESIPFVTVTNVPTAAERKGDFSGTRYTIYDPTTTVCNSAGGTLGNCKGNNYSRTAFTGDVIPAKDISPIGTALINLFPMPNTNVTSDRNNFIAAVPDKYRYDQPMGRLDYNTSDRTRWYSTFEWQKGHEFRDSSGFTGAAENGNINTMRANIVASQDMTHVFSPTLVGDFKLSFARFRDLFPNGPLSTPTPGSIGLNYPHAPTTTLSLLPQITFNETYPQVVGNSVSGHDYTNTVIDADFTKSKGRHNIEFGGEIGEYNFGDPEPGGSPNGDFKFYQQETQYNPTKRDELPGITDGNVLASLLLGYPGGGGVDWNTTVAEGTPMWDIYGQDNIRISHKLTVQIGLRYDVQRGLRERYNRLNRGLCLSCVNPLTNNPTYQANLAADTPALLKYGFTPAEVSALGTLYGGIQFPGVGGQPVDAYNTDWSDIGPRIGFAYALNSKTVVRGGWGWMYSYGIEGGTTTGFSQGTGYIDSLNGGITPTNYFLNGAPFPTGLQTPTGSSLGLLTSVGNQANLDFPGRRIPRIQIMSLGFQRELPGHMLLDVKYAGNYTRNLRDHVWVNGNFALSGGPMQGSVCNPPLSGNVGYPQLQQGTYNSCVGDFYNNQVVNPFYGVLPPNTNGGESPTIQAARLLNPYPQYDLVGDYTMPLGRVWYDSLQVKLDKRLYGVSRGLSFQVAYTYAKNMQSDGWRNGWPWQDAHQVYEETGDDRTHILTWSGVWDLPMGKGAKYLAPNASGPLGAIINNWRFSWIFTAQSGFPEGIGDGDWPVAGYSWAVPGGSYFGQWINNCGFQPANCFISRPAFSQGNQPDRVSYVRQPTVPDLDLTLEKDIPVTESKHFQLRVDAFNFTNTPLFGGPDTNYNDGPPKRQANGNWQGFGTINLFQDNFPRIVQLTLKFYF
ncbi:MAG: carboxypeptidase regulatory-like domain-containing protein [Terriglobia bacterium]